MSMLDRYRKPGGFVQLLALIETSVPAKQERFLQLIREESPAWEAELLKYKMSFQKILTWNSTYLIEFWSRMPDKVLGTAAFRLSAADREVFLNSVGPLQRRNIKEIFDGNPPTEGEILSCQLKIIGEIRVMTMNGPVRLDKIDHDFAVPEKIDEMLAGHNSSPSVSAAEQSVSHAPSKDGTGQINPAAVLLVEEMKEMRKKLQAAQNEAQQLRDENHGLKSKLEQIRRIA